MKDTGRLARDEAAKAVRNGEGGPGIGWRRVPQEGIVESASVEGAEEPHGRSKWQEAAARETRVALRETPKLKRGCIGSGPDPGARVREEDVERQAERPKAKGGLPEANRAVLPVVTKTLQSR